MKAKSLTADFADGRRFKNRSAMQGLRVESSFREMQPRERELIRKLLEPTFPGRDDLVEQLQTATVRTVDEDGSFEFLISQGSKAISVKYAVPTEGEYEDPDGITVHVLLHVRGNNAKELEFFREDNERVQTWPDLASVRVFAPE